MQFFLHAIILITLDWYVILLAFRALRGLRLAVDLLVLKESLLESQLTFEVL